MRILVEEGMIILTTVAAARHLFFSTRYLFIQDCSSLESLTSSRKLPATLQNLHIFRCQELESVAKSFHHNIYIDGPKEQYKLLQLPSAILKLNVQVLLLFSSSWQDFVYYCLCLNLR